MTKSDNKSHEIELPKDLPLPLASMVESLLFVSSEPVQVNHLAEALNVSIEQVEHVLTEFKEGSTSRGLRLQRKGERVQLTTRPEVAPYIEKFLGLDLSSRLSKPALETLSIVAYQQPVTRAQIEQVRGVNCDGVLSTLLTKGLIEETGRLETAGRPIQYGTTFAFLQHFGLRGLEDLPALNAGEATALEAMATINTEVPPTIEQALSEPIANEQVASNNEQLANSNEPSAVSDQQPVDGG
jgi:segregation and condensation protein B